jgi:hypothetical protein
MEIARRRLAKIRRQSSRRPVVGGMATMPTRADTFAPAFKSIMPQLDRLYLYLDGHEEIPEPARHAPRVIPIFAHTAPGLHGNGKFLGLLLSRDRADIGRSGFERVDSGIVGVKAEANDPDARRLARDLFQQREVIHDGFHNETAVTAQSRAAGARQTR